MPRGWTARTERKSLSEENIKTLSALNGRSLLKELRDVIERKVIVEFSALSRAHIMILDVSNTKMPFWCSESILKLLFFALEMICLTSGGRLHNSLRLTISVLFFFFFSPLLFSLIFCYVVFVLVFVFCVLCFVLFSFLKTKN